MTLLMPKSAVTPKPSSIPNSNYLAFVDGLRAVSILAVVGCHIGLPGFSGGYVGVDVFFVISGFLIINQIKDGLEAGRFSITSFYARRVLRILPPFLVMFLSVALVAPFLLPTPAITSDFVSSAFLSPAMLTNVLFYFRQGYFDLQANEKPLLHTWTLSVEEQFYLVIPFLLVLLFRLKGGRFGATAVTTGVILGLASLAGAIADTSTDGPNAAFYLTHWRMWEFIAGGFIGVPLVAAAQRLPRVALEVMGLAGLALIIAAVGLFDSKTPYPSWRALLPVAGATLVILSGLAQPRTIAARSLATRAMVGIGLVSYAWYLWHWPILTFMRFPRLGEPWLLGDFVGGGLVGLALATASYFFLERPIRRWKKATGVPHPGRIFARGVAACAAASIAAGLIAIGGHFWLKSYIASTYGIDGKGRLENGCRTRQNAEIPPDCFAGRFALLMGDSRADAMFGSFARNFNDMGVKLVLIGRGGCSPLHLSRAERENDRHHACADLLAPFERLLAAPKSITSVIVTPSAVLPNSVERWTGLLSQFDPSSTRILLVEPPPEFIVPILECVVLGDRYGTGRQRCIEPRAKEEKGRENIVNILKAAANNGFGNIRYIDPLDTFCDAQVCRPFQGNQMFYRDGAHLTTLGADRLYDAFEKDFRWVAWAD